VRGGVTQDAARDDAIILLMEVVMKKINLLLALCLMCSGSLALAMDDMDKGRMEGGSMKMEKMDAGSTMKMENKGGMMMKDDAMDGGKMTKKPMKPGKKHKSKKMKKMKKHDEMKPM